LLQLVEQEEGVSKALVREALQEHEELEQAYRRQSYLDMIAILTETQIAAMNARTPPTPEEPRSKINLLKRKEALHRRLSGLTQAGVFAEELEQPPFKQSAIVKKTLERVESSHASKLPPITSQDLQFLQRALRGDVSPEVKDWQQKNRTRMPDLASGYDAFRSAHESSKIGLRSLGFLQAANGMSQIAISVPLAATGVGLPFASANVVLGADNFIAGFQTMWSEKSQPTVLFQLINHAGQKTGWYGTTEAAFIEMGLNLGSVASLARQPKALTFMYRLGTGNTASANSAFNESITFSEKAINPNHSIVTPQSNLPKADDLISGKDVQL